MGEQERTSEDREDALERSARACERVVGGREEEWVPGDRLRELRQAEAELEKVKADAKAALNSMFETAKQAMEEPHPLVAMGAYFEYSLGTMGDAYQTEGFRDIVAERDSLQAQLDEALPPPGCTCLYQQGKRKETMAGCPLHDAAFAQRRAARSSPPTEGK